MPRIKGKQGFASMDPEKRRAAQSKGGKTGHARGTARKWTSRTARIAGLRSGISYRPARLGKYDGERVAVGSLDVLGVVKKGHTDSEN